MPLSRSWLPSLLWLKYSELDADPFMLQEPHVQADECQAPVLLLDHALYVQRVLLKTRMIQNSHINTVLMMQAAVTVKVAVHQVFMSETPEQWIYILHP